MRLFSLAVLLLGASALAGCDGVSSTYPPAGDFPLLTIAEAFEAPPGRYNVDGCVDLRDPQDVRLFESCAGRDDPPPPPELALALDVDAPGQFREETPYRFSLEAVGAPGFERVFRVLGYARLR